MSFAKEGRVSVWIGQRLIDPTSDFLAEQFRATEYDIDFQDCIIEESPASLRTLATQLSYAPSFLDQLLAAAQLGVSKARWIMAQYEYEYDAAKAGLSVLPDEPLFVGAFDWHE